MPKFKPGDRVRFTDKALRESPGIDTGAGTVIRCPFLGGKSAWLQIHWDNDNWSTEKPEWLERI